MDEQNENIFIEKNEEKYISAIKSKSSELEILEFIKIIGYNQYMFIKQLSNNYYISGGKHELNLYDPLYILKTTIKLYDLITSYYYIYEINCNYSEIRIAIFCTNEYYVVTIDLNNFEKNISKKYLSINLSLQNIFFQDEKENKYINTGNNGLYKITNNLNSRIVEKAFMKESSFVSGIEIDNNISALTSNSIIPFGEDKLILYNEYTNVIKKEINDYSFRISSNCLSLMENVKEGIKYKILLCACKKYSKRQKNGILLVNISKLDDSRTTNELFYETGPFEVDCFCPISIVENKNNENRKDIAKEKNIEIIKTEFFFVGGFDEDKREGMIKLFKINYNNEIDIEFIQDIITNDKNDDDNNKFEGFGRSITSIIQSSILGNILVTSLDGNVYLFKPPNINYFLNNNYL